MGKCLKNMNLEPLPVRHICTLKTILGVWHTKKMRTSMLSMWNNFLSVEEVFLASAGLFSLSQILVLRMTMRRRGRRLLNIM